jgi:hypothetical protein
VLSIHHSGGALDCVVSICVQLHGGVPRFNFGSVSSVSAARGLSVARSRSQSSFAAAVVPRSGVGIGAGVGAGVGAGAGAAGGGGGVGVGTSSLPTPFSGVGAGDAFGASAPLSTLQGLQGLHSVELKLQGHVYTTECIFRVVNWLDGNRLRYEVVDIRPSDSLTGETVAFLKVCVVVCCSVLLVSARAACVELSLAMPALQLLDAGTAAAVQVYGNHPDVLSKLTSTLSESIPDLVLDRKKSTPKSCLLKQASTVHPVTTTPSLFTKFLHLTGHLLQSGFVSQVCSRRPDTEGDVVARILMPLSERLDVTVRVSDDTVDDCPNISMSPSKPSPVVAISALVLVSVSVGVVCVTFFAGPRVVVLRPSLRGQPSHSGVHVPVWDVVPAAVVTGAAGVVTAAGGLRVDRPHRSCCHQRCALLFRDLCVEDG